LKEGFAAALNARGVAYLKLGAERAALHDFTNACHSAPGFADAQASLGTFWLHRRAPQSADPCFKAALSKSRDFGLAVNGQGCAMYGYETNISAAFEIFKSAAQTPMVALLASQNINQVILAEAAEVRGALADEKAGTTISSADLFSKYQQLQDNIKWNQGISSHGWAIPNLTLFGFGGGFGNLMESTKYNLANQQQQLADIKAQLAGRGLGGLVNTPVGGAKTEGIKVPPKFSRRWPVTTWFGLAQEVTLAQSTPSPR
jgi:tetratricopeptide (TPR) repeat protein